MKKKLSLNKETIRNLTADEMKQVAGAGTNTTVGELCCITCSPTCTCNTCFTDCNCITGEPFCLVTDGKVTCECV